MVGKSQVLKILNNTELQMRETFDVMSSLTYDQSLASLLVVIVPELHVMFIFYILQKRLWPKSLLEVIKHFFFD